MEAVHFVQSLNACGEKNEETKSGKRKKRGF
jgi:hypothetical protein